MKICKSNPESLRVLMQSSGQTQRRKVQCVCVGKVTVRLNGSGERGEVKKIKVGWIQEGHPSYKGTKGGSAAMQQEGWLEHSRGVLWETRGEDKRGVKLRQTRTSKEW